MTASPLGQGKHDGGESLGFLISDGGGPAARGDREGVAEPRAEVAHHEGRHLLPRDKRPAAAQQHAPRRHQIRHLLKRHLRACVRPPSAFRVQAPGTCWLCKPAPLVHPMLCFLVSATFSLSLIFVCGDAT